MAVPTPMSEAKKRKMRLKRLQPPCTTNPSEVNDHEVQNTNNFCPLRLKTTTTEFC